MLSQDYDRCQGIAAQDYLYNVHFHFSENPKCQSVAIGSSGGATFDQRGSWLANGRTTPTGMAVVVGGYFGDVLHG
jgi:hypothetical protein